MGTKILWTGRNRGLWVKKESVIQVGYQFGPQDAVALTIYKYFFRPYHRLERRPLRACYDREVWRFGPVELERITP